MDSVKDFQFFSLACDETTDITNTAQMTVFVCVITAVTRSHAWHYYRGGLVSSMKKVELSFEKLNGLITDGAPAMNGLFVNKNYIALV